MIKKNVLHALRLFITNVKVMARADVLIEKGVTIKYSESLVFGEHVTLQSGVYLYGSRSGHQVKFGNRVVLAPGVTVLGEGGAEFGDFTHLGPGVICTTQYGDSTGKMCSSSPTIKTAAIRLGRGCWIGSGAILMPGATLGNECIVAPNSVVFGVWPDGTKLSGSPARRDLRANAVATPAEQAS